MPLHNYTLFSLFLHCLMERKMKTNYCLETTCQYGKIHKYTYFFKYFTLRKWNFRNVNSSGTGKLL